MARLPPLLLSLGKQQKGEHHRGPPLPSASVWNPPHTLLQIGGKKSGNSVHAVEWAANVGRHMAALGAPGGSAAQGLHYLPANSHTSAPLHVHTQVVSQSQTHAERNREPQGRPVERERHGIMAEGACDF